MIPIWRQLALLDYWKTVPMYELKYKGCHASIKLHTVHVVTGHAVVGRIKLWGLKYAQKKESKRSLISEHIKKLKIKEIFTSIKQNRTLFIVKTKLPAYITYLHLPIFTC